MADEHTELVRTHDPLRAQMLAELLKQEGIPVATPGLEHRSMLGVAGGYIEISVKVPQRDWQRSRELMEAFEAATPLDESFDDAPERISYDYREPARVKTRLSPKMRRIAMFAALMFPGGGHVYVGRWSEASAIVMAQLASFTLSLLGLPYGGLLVLLSKAADILGSVAHCEHINRQIAATSEIGTRATPPRRDWRMHSAFGSAVLTLAWVLFAVGPGARWLAGPAATAECETRSTQGESLHGCLWRAYSERAAAYSERAAASDAESLTDATTRYGCLGNR